MLRKTNYNTGTMKSQHKQYDSIYKDDYPEHPLNMAQLNEDQKKDLRTHHFKFGYGQNGKNDKISNYQQEYIKKEVPQGVREEFLDAKNKARSSVNSKIYHF